MIDIKKIRENPQTYIDGAKAKNIQADIDTLLEIDAKLLDTTRELQDIRTEQNVASKQISKLSGDQKQAAIEKVGHLKEQSKQLNEVVAQLQPQFEQLLLHIPQPAGPEVPIGASADENVELSKWNPDWFDPAKSFAENKGFQPKSHIELGESLGLMDFQRGVKMSGSRSYVLTGDGMLLHHAVLRMALDFMVHENGFTPVSVPIVVREEMMVGTGFFPFGKDDAYEIPEVARGGGHGLYLVGTGEVGLMGLRSGDMIDYDELPLKYCTVSTCLRREAGSAGKDTAGLFRIHQFEKVEQVVICAADDTESDKWHKKMLSYSEQIVRKLEMPYRLLQCCSGDLGPKNVDMIDVETWMPSRGPDGPDGRPTGQYCETHSASRLDDYQCRRLNIRYRDPQTGKPVVCHSLNDTVAASPRILIPIIELNQNADGSVTVPKALRPYMGGIEKIQPKS